MLKKRAMSDARWVSELTEQFIARIIEKRLETGYAHNQPKYPYWVRPLNYSAPEWLQINVWIIDTMGSGDWSIEHGRWVGSDRKYWFRDERDRTMFILRWS
jgi:hypothetical protein